MQCVNELYKVKEISYQFMMLQFAMSHFTKLNAHSMGLNSGVLCGRVIA